MQAALIPHPSTPCEFIASFDAFASVSHDRTLSIHYVAAGDIDQILLPASKPARRADWLWQHTCFEAFAGGDGVRAYYEFNFSPSTCWAAYGFEDYRTGMTELPLRIAPHIVCRRSTRALKLEVQVTLGESIGRAHNDLRIGLAAVIEDKERRKSYWAPAHADAAPDFHRAEGFTLTATKAGLEP